MGDFIQVLYIRNRRRFGILTFSQTWYTKWAAPWAVVTASQLGATDPIWNPPIIIEKKVMRSSPPVISSSATSLAPYLKDDNIVRNNDQMDANLFFREELNNRTRLLFSAEHALAQILTFSLFCFGFYDQLSWLFFVISSWRGK